MSDGSGARPHIVLINPWITDFAAYNFWVKPLGLLTIAGLLREQGYRVSLIDCLDGCTREKRFGDGNFLKTRIEKPGPLRDIPRYYSQYGISEAAFLQRLSSIRSPDVIGFTSGMTYWYPGLFKAIQMTRDFFRGAPVLLGGIYATLCPEHASKYSGADFIVEGAGELEALRLIGRLTGVEACSPRAESDRDFQFQPLHFPLDFDLLPYPAFDLYPRLDFVCIRTTRGCPLNCTYCASRLLYSRFDRRDPLRVVEEIEHWSNWPGVKHIAFYDDAFLIHPRDHVIPVLKEILKRGIRSSFHTPNGLHIREIDEEVAALLFKTGFKTIRLF